MATAIAARSMAALTCALALGSSGCSGRPPAAANYTADNEPHWQDAFARSPQLLATVFPTALRSDKIYGPLLRRVIALARERSRVVAETRALDAIEDAEQVIVGIDLDSPASDGADREPANGGEPELANGVVVIRGVRADVDPAHVVDDEGRPIWTAGPAGQVRELVRNAPTVAASLFELPGRTWVIASGVARERAREVFAHPLPRARSSFGDGLLAAIRVDGPTLVARVHVLQTRDGFAAVAAHHLEALTLELPPGADRQVRAALSYSDENAAAAASASVQELLEAVRRRKPDALLWLTSATLERHGKVVTLTAPLTLHLAEHLQAGGISGEMGPPPQ